MGKVETSNNIDSDFKVVVVVVVVIRAIKGKKPVAPDQGYELYIFLCAC